jgi:hypothetical protein
MMVFLDMAEKSSTKEAESDIDKDKTKLKYKSAGKGESVKDAVAQDLRHRAYELFKTTLSKRNTPHV